MVTDSKSIVPFRLVNITTEEFAVFKENFDGGDESFGINLDVQFRANTEEHVVGVFSKFTFDQHGQMVMILGCACHFLIKDEYWQTIITNEQLVLDAGLLEHFLVLTVGTARGIVHAKRPTWLHSLILPTMNISSIVKGDLVFDLRAEEEE